MKPNINLLSALLFFPLIAFADDHHQKGSKTFPVVTNKIYKESCGSCHFAYQPGLLPSRSWVKIVDESNAHAGGDISLGEKTKAEVKNYLAQNSAENSKTEKSRKILDSIGNDTPVMISETPYIKHKHHQISEDVFARKAIGSRGNCIACHKSAESGIYDDDDVIIPK